MAEWWGETKERLGALDDMRLIVGEVGHLLADRVQVVSVTEYPRPDEQHPPSQKGTAQYREVMDGLRFRLIIFTEQETEFDIRLRPTVLEMDAVLGRACDALDKRVKRVQEPVVEAWIADFAAEPLGALRHLVRNRLQDASSDECERVASLLRDYHGEKVGVCKEAHNVDA